MSRNGGKIGLLEGKGNLDTEKVLFAEGIKCSGNNYVKEERERKKVLERERRGVFFTGKGWS